MAREVQVWPRKLFPGKHRYGQGCICVVREVLYGQGSTVITWKLQTGPGKYRYGQGSTGVVMKGQE